jgi:hypothetical protein
MRDSSAASFDNDFEDSAQARLASVAWEAPAHRHRR